MKTILLIGGCGSGKTWTMISLLEKLTTKPCKIGLIHFRYDLTKKIALLGVYDGSTFQGSDRLSMAVMKDIKLLKKFQAKENAIIIAEGDRFTNSTFINTMQPYIIKIKDTGEAGRAKRNSNQTERQIKSIQTRVNNIQESKAVLNSGQALLLISKIIENEKN